MADETESFLERGYAARRRSQPKEARELFQQALDQAREAPRLETMARALEGLGNAERDMGNVEASLEHYNEALALFRSSANLVACAHTERHIGDIYRESGRLQEAEMHFRQTLSVYRGRPETPPLELANTLRGLALTVDALGDRERAAKLWAEALPIYEKAEIAAGIHECQRRLAESA